MDKYLTIEIPKRIESANKVVNRYNRFAYKNYRDGWYKVLKFFFPAQPVRPTRKLELTIESHRKRYLDKGNMVQGCKPILDFLVKANYLRGDSPPWVNDQYLQYSGCKEEKTVIRIEKS